MSGVFFAKKDPQKLVVPNLSTSTLWIVQNDEYFKKEEDVWGFKIKTAQLKGNVILNATSLVVCSTVVATSEKKGTCSASLLPFRRKLQLLFFFSLVFSVVVNNNCGWMEEATTVCRKPHHVLFISTPDHHQAPAVSFPWKKIKTPRVYSASIFYF